MLSPAFRRAVRAASGLPPAAAVSLRPAAVSACSAAAQSLVRPPHQRRPSSSKPSIPPDGSKHSSPAQQTPDAAADAAPAKAVDAAAGKSRVKATKSVAKRAADRSRKKKAAPALHLPQVPPTDHLQKPDVRISSFFSLHRPLYITAGIPPSATQARFNMLFERRRPSLLDNIQILSTGVHHLDAAIAGAEQRAAADDDGPSFTDGPGFGDGPPAPVVGAPEPSVDDVLARHHNFVPPPAPVPLDRWSTVRSRPREAPRPARRKAWSTTLVVTESTDAAGTRVYMASRSPMVEVPVQQHVDEPHAADQVEVRQPFLNRLRQRQMAFDRARRARSHASRRLLLISVKRQRRLKMKKHKYKKLMKRTRLERRKLDRA